MGRKTQRTARPTRWEKSMQARDAALEAPQPTSNGFTTRAPTAPTIEAKTQNQKTALRMLNEGRQIIFLTGSAGTGKSMLACYRAASLLHTKRIDKIYLARPAVGMGKSIGLLPGEVSDKLGPYFKQTIAHLERFLGKGFVAYCMKPDVLKIEMVPAEYLRGMSLEDCFVLVEEAQNFTHEDMECVITRLGEGCQMVFTGDTKQNDLRSESGLKTTVALIDKHLQTHPSYMDADDMDALDDGVGVVQFMPEDVVRSGLTRAFVKMYYNT